MESRHKHIERQWASHFARSRRRH